MSTYYDSKVVAVISHYWHNCNWTPAIKFYVFSKIIVQLFNNETYHYHFYFDGKIKEWNCLKKINCWIFMTDKLIKRKPFFIGQPSCVWVCALKKAPFHNECFGNWIGRFFLLPLPTTHVENKKVISHWFFILIIIIYLAFSFPWPNLLIYLPGSFLEHRVNISCLCCICLLFCLLLFWMYPKRILSTHSQ